MPDQPATATCSVCGRTLSVKKNGTLRHHRSDIWENGRPRYRCAGSGVVGITTERQP